MELEIRPIKLNQMDKELATAITKQTKQVLLGLAIPKELLGDSRSRTLPLVTVRFTQLQREEVNGYTD